MGMMNTFLVRMHEALRVLCGNKLIIISIFLVAVSIAWLQPFITIMLTGKYVVGEDSVWILKIEILLFIYFVWYAVWSIAKETKSIDDKAKGMRLINELKKGE